MNTFEPCGYRSKRTGALVIDLVGVWQYGARTARNRKMSRSQFEEWWPQHFEVVYRLVSMLESDGKKQVEE